VSTPALSNLSGTRAETRRDPAVKRIRVLHVNSGNLYGGVEKILVTLARLRDLCPTMEAHFAICHEGRLGEELRDAQAPVYMLGQVRFSRPWTVWRARRRLREVLRRNRFDVVICHMPWAFAVFAKVVRDAGPRLAFWAHAFHHGRGWLEHLARRIQPEVAIANSNYTQAGLVNLFPGIRHGVVYPPVELTSVPQSDGCRAAVREELEAAEEKVIIIQVGRLEAGKGHALFLEALALLKDLQEWETWIVGGAQTPDEHAYLEWLQNTSVRLGIGDRVRFLGERTDVQRLLMGADIYCHPNQQPESFGIVFIEAMWAGRPVITSGMGGALEIIDDSCGILVSPGDAALFADALRRLIGSRELRLRLGQRGPKRAMDLCDPAMQIQTLQRLVWHSDLP
jgi:glycosyltransferase involved in cell wall biosynthesis